MRINDNITNWFRKIFCTNCDLYKATITEDNPCPNSKCYGPGSYKPKQQIFHDNKYSFQDLKRQLIRILGYPVRTELSFDYNEDMICCYNIIYNDIQLLNYQVTIFSRSESLCEIYHLKFYNKYCQIFYYNDLLEIFDEDDIIPSSSHKDKLTFLFPYLKETIKTLNINKYHSYY